MANLYSIVSEQFPEFVRANHDKFIKFIETYYEWVAEQQSVQKLSELVDIDQTANDFITYFQNQLDILGLVSQVPQFDKKYLRLIKQLYTAKGSEQALLFLLRLNFNVDAQIQYPSQSILRTSDGNWYQESFITIDRVSGILVPDDVPSITRVFVINDEAEIPVTVTRVVAVNVAPNGDVLSLRVYFKKTFGIGFSLNQRVIVRNAQSVTIYTGTIVPSPASIRIDNGGRDWIAGQIITIPGTTVPTTVRITRINSIGSITGVEIVDHGYRHSNPQTLTAAAYPNRPLGSSFELNQTGARPGDITYNLKVRDSVAITEDVSGYYQNISSYFAEDYAVDITYAGFDEVFSITSTYTPPGTSYTPGITLDQWLASQATITLNFATVVDTKGQWLSDRGQTSNTNIRLQDNFYYQQYSYVIDSEANPNIYRDLAAKVHPAGMKMFTQHTLTRSYSLEPEATTSFPFVVIALTEQGSVSDSAPTVTFTKKLVDETAIIDGNVLRTLNKYSLSDGTAGITSTTSSFVDEGVYTEETYFSEIYTTRTYTLSISST